MQPSVGNRWLSPDLLAGAHEHGVSNGPGTASKPAQASTIRGTDQPSTQLVAQRRHRLRSLFIVVGAVGLLLPGAGYGYLTFNEQLKTIEERQGSHAPAQRHAAPPTSTRSPEAPPNGGASSPEHARTLASGSYFSLDTQRQRMLGLQRGLAPSRDGDS